MEKYRPSNGVAGDCFMGRFCDKCETNDPELGCDIQSRTMAYDVTDAAYPDEWIYDGDENPTCTAFKP